MTFILYFNLLLFLFLEKRFPKMNVETNSNGSPVWHGLDVGPILNLVLPRMNFLDVLITSKLWNIHFLSARKSQLALLVIAFFFKSLLVFKSLIKSNYSKSTPTHSEPPSDSDKIFKEFTKSFQIRTPPPQPKSTKNSQKVS